MGRGAGAAPVEIGGLPPKRYDNLFQDIDKKKYLVPDELTIGQFIYVIRNRMKLKPDEAIFLFINKRMMPTTAIIGQIYSQEKDNDGFIYIEYSKENVFG